MVSLKRMFEMQSELTEHILGLKPGDHLCLFYKRNPAEQMPALIPFIQDGLSRDEQFIYIADDQTVDELADRLHDSGINVGKESDRGALKLWTRREWRQAGELSSAKKTLQVLDLIREASQSGFNGSRFAVEMTWALGPDIDAALLEHWEATLNTIFVPGFPGRIACQYNQSRLSPEVMLAALHTHPQAILGDDVFPNFFYEAPLILEGSSRSASARLEWMIGELKRSRAADRKQRRLEEQLRHAQKMESIGTLAGGIAHDFNNVLNIIRGYASLLTRDLVGNDDAIQNLKVIDESVERGAALVRQLLTVARKAETHLAPTHLNEVISELAKLVSHTFPKTIDISLELDPTVPPVMADSNRISQVLLNLWVNARDAMPTGGQLTVRTKTADGRELRTRFAEATEGKYLKIEITDTGFGMNDTVRSRIFEPFFTTKGVGEGSGLGLSMVYGIVKNHHGLIDVESEVNHGTTLRVYFPVPRAEESQVNGSTAKEPSENKSITVNEHWS
jgi:signal transduction histidine kinase